MTALTINADPGLERLLIAGRKAAAIALLIEAHDRQRVVSGPDMEDYDGKDRLMINDIDVGPAIDAAVLEVMVQMRHQEPPPRRKLGHGSRWKFWA